MTVPDIYILFYVQNINYIFYTLIPNAFNILQYIIYALYIIHIFIKYKIYVYINNIFYILYREFNKSF